MNHDKQIPRDPVCGRRMNRNKAWAIVRYNKIEYLLCCPRCQSEFESEPDHFLQTSAKK